MKPQILGRVKPSTIIVAVASAMLAIFAVVVLTSGTSSGAGQLQPAQPFSVGELGHPSTQISLSGYAGKPVIVNFFASWCAECQSETPELARFYRQSHGSTVIIGIDANDSTAKALPWIRSKGVSYPVGVDAHGLGPATAYGVNALPQTFFLDAQHRIVKRIYGAVTASDLRQGVALMDHPPAALSASG